MIHYKAKHPHISLKINVYRHYIITNLMLMCIRTIRKAIKIGVVLTKRHSS